MEDQSGRAPGREAARETARETTGGTPSPATRDATSYRRRAVSATALVGTVAAVTLIGVVQLVFSGSAREAADRVLIARTDAVIRSIEATSSGHTLNVPGEQLGPGVAVYDEAGSLIAGSAPRALADRYEELATVSQVTRVKENGAEVVAQPFRTSQRAAGVVVSAQSLDAYTDDEQEALMVALLAGVVIVLLTTALAGWVSKRVLQPVAEMAKTADEWSERDLARRFDLGPPRNEISALGATLDHLLDKVASAIRTEQRLTSEVAHELRTPLTAIQGTADLIAMRTDLDEQLREDVEDIQRGCRAMAQAMTSLLELARGDEDVVIPGAEAALVGWALTSELGSPTGLDIDIPAGLSLGVPTQLAVRALAPVVTNGLKHGSQVRLTARHSDGMVVFSVADDGPGVLADRRDRIFEVGQSGDGGSGLGLPLARRIARSAGGDVVLDQARALGEPGAVFLVSLPAG